jgi:hypothetical protein
MLVVGMVAALAVCSCETATFHSTRFDLKTPPPASSANGPGNFGPRQGTAYFLPKGYIHLIAEVQNGSSTGTGKSATGTNAQTAAQPSAGAPQDTAPVAAAIPHYKLTVDVTILPDGGNMFLLRPKTSAWAHDTFGITIQNGLLTSVGSSNSDQTGTVLLKLAELAGTMAAGLKATPYATNPPAALPARIELMFAPDDTAEANLTLQKGRLNVVVNRDFPFIQPQDRDNLPATSAGKPDDEGIFYRPLLPYTVTVNEENNQTTYSTVVLLPNDGPILSLVPKRASLVTAKTSIVFDHGCPTAVSFDRASPAVAWASLPIDMVKAFLSAPAELVQLKFNFANSNAQLSSAELAGLNNQISILKQQLAIEQFMRTNSLSGGH